MSGFITPGSDDDDDDDDDCGYDGGDDDASGHRGRGFELSILPSSLCCLFASCLIAPPLFFLSKLLMRISCYVDVRGTLTCCLPAPSL